MCPRSMSLLVMARLQCKVLRASQVRHCLEPRTVPMTTTIFGEHTTCVVNSVGMLQTFCRCFLACCHVTLMHAVQIDCWFVLLCCTIFYSYDNNYIFLNFCYGVTAYVISVLNFVTQFLGVGSNGRLYYKECQWVFTCHIFPVAQWQYIISKWS